MCAALDNDVMSTASSGRGSWRQASSGESAKDDLERCGDRHGVDDDDEQTASRHLIDDHSNSAQERPCRRTPDVVTTNEPGVKVFCTSSFENITSAMQV